MKKTIILFLLFFHTLFISAVGFKSSPSFSNAVIGLADLLDIMVYTGLSLGVAGLLLDIFVRQKQDGLRKGLLYLVALGVYMIIREVFL